MTKRVLITGVSSGIGLAQARLFLEKGYQVYGVDQGERFADGVREIAGRKEKDLCRVPAFP